MLKHFKTFFHPTVITYSYNQPKEIVIAKITEVFKQKVTLFSSNDMTGKFLNPDTFAISTVSFANTQGVEYGSTLVGHIVESENGETKINTKATPSFVFSLVFFITTIFGVIYFFKSIQTGLTEGLFWSLGLLILGPAISIGLSNVAIHSVRERYKMYIDKALIP